MKMHFDSGTDGYRVTGYGPDFVSVNGQRYTSSLLVSPDWVESHWVPSSVTELSEKDLGSILEHEPDVLLLGTGDRQQFPPPALMAKIGAAGVGLEVMTTPAACRTYNILMAEGRKVVAALILVRA